MGWIVVILIAFIILVVWLSQRRRPSQNTSHQLTTAKVAGEARVTKNKTMELLRLAYTKRLRVTVEYETGNPKPEEPARKVRDIDIYGLGNEYFDAYCHHRSAQRTFKISRVLWVRICDETYQIPPDYVPTGWVTEGKGELAEATLEQSVEIAPPNTLHSRAEKGRQPSMEASKYRQGGKVTKSYVRYDWEGIFEDSIMTSFPDELSPALPYLYEAYRLEKEGANQQKIQKLIEKARKVDSKATSFYLVRRSIMRARRKQISELE